jgi:hypothetical protein
MGTCVWARVLADCAHGWVRALGRGVTRCGLVILDYREDGHHNVTWVTDKVRLDWLTAVSREGPPDPRWRGRGNSPMALAGIASGPDVGAR